MNDFIVAALLMFFSAFVVEFLVRVFGRMFGLFATVQEGTSRVYVLFGKVVCILDEPGLHILPLRMGPKAFIINILGSCRIIDLDDDKVPRSVIDFEVTEDRAAVPLLP